MPTRSMTQLTLLDHLSHLTYAKACRLLGARAKELLARGGTCEIDIEAQVRLTADRLDVMLGSARVAIELGPGVLGLTTCCSECARSSHDEASGARGQRARPASSHDRCKHVAAALSLVLEEKTLLGLAAPPPERVPVGALSETEIAERALAERRERANKEKMRVRSEDSKRIWSDYQVMSAISGHRGCSHR